MISNLTVLNPKGIAEKVKAILIPEVKKALAKQECLLTLSLFPKKN